MNDILTQYDQFLEHHINLVIRYFSAEAKHAREIFVAGNEVSKMCLHIEDLLRQDEYDKVIFASIVDFEECD